MSDALHFGKMVSFENLLINLAVQSERILCLGSEEFNDGFLKEDQIELLLSILTAGFQVLPEKFSITEKEKESMEQAFLLPLENFLAKEVTKEIKSRFQDSIEERFELS